MRGSLRGKSVKGSLWGKLVRGSLWGKSLWGFLKQVSERISLGQVSVVGSFWKRSW